MADITKEQLAKAVQSKNLAETYTDDLVEIGTKVIEYFDDDDLSRHEWKERNRKWLKLATQVVEKKSYPWPDAANVKFPLLTTAAMQFAARAYPALVPGPNLVAGLVIGQDEQGIKAAAAKRVGAHMSYQLMYEMEDWEEEMDKLCLMLPIVGCLFKKTYFNSGENKNVSELVLPDDFVVDYYAKSIEKANRVSHIIYLTKNQIEERVRRGIFLDVDLPEPVTVARDSDSKDKINGSREPKVSPATPHKIVECHCFWDLDNDGYDEPYIITVHYESKQVLRIVARFEVDGIETQVDEKTGKDKIVSIKPTHYFTKFGFIPNPDGSLYDLGFGLLLGGINESVNTLTNQLLDSGTLNNLQAGFLGRGIRIRSGGSRFQPGEWKPVDFTGDDIKKNIFPLPTKEPSDVLFKLLEALVTSGKELASVAEIMVGKMPGQNTPATTTMATIEQGLKVFTAIHKRIYRALSKEYAKLFALNKINLDEQVYFTINQPEGPEGMSVSQSDYADGISVKPNADPNVVSSAQKLMKVQSYGALLQLGTINPLEYTKRYLEAVEAENIKTLLNTEPQPDPEQQKMQAEMAMKQQEMEQKSQLEQLKFALKQKEGEMDMQMKQMDLYIKALEAKLDAQIAQTEAQVKQQSAQQDMELQHQKHQLDQSMQVQQHEHDTKMMEKEGQLKEKQIDQQGKLMEQKAKMQKQQASKKPTGGK